MSQRPDLAVVVLSHRANPLVLGAVDSLLALPEPLEIVVVNSGGGDAPALLAHCRGRLKVLEFSETLWPGAVRNRGIKATRAPYVAFLADDCRAGAGWAATRIAAHRSGVAAVASALLPDSRRHPVAIASHLALYARRLPGVPEERALKYGVSYLRRLFDRVGLFREDLRTGEDTEFNARLRKREAPRWHPEVQTIHGAPRSLTAMLREQWGRGARSVTAYVEIGRPVPPRKLIDNIAVRSRQSIEFSHGSDGSDFAPAALRAAWPLVWLANLAHCGSALRQTRRLAKRAGGQS
jgi:glycosyltransferase involved in cell wall biosynthesis